MKQITKKMRAGRGNNARRAKRMAWIVAAGVALAGAFAPSGAHAVSTQQLQQQIDALSAQNAQAQQNVSQLQSQASSYQDMINKLQSQISSLQQQISDNTAKQQQLTQQIGVAQDQLNQEKKVLGEDIKAMYVNGSMSTTEMLATSKNLSTFVDAETYRGAVQKKIQDTLAKITQLQNQLKDQKNQVENLLQSQQLQQSQLGADQAQQNQLLAMNEGQQAAYNQQIQSNQSQISSLRSQIIAANTSGVSRTLSRGTCGGGYPNNLCNAAQDSIVDPWHMLNRECVSYAAWRASEESTVANALLQAHSFGNAGDWPAAARAYGAQYGVTVSTTPQAGDIAIRPAISGAYVAPGDPDVGHAMYVEAVNGDGTVTVSQYNAYLDGTYSEDIRSTSGTYHGVPYQLQFIHFP